MQILVARGASTGKSTPSIVSVNGVQYFFGLEPANPVAAGVYPVAVEIHFGNGPGDTEGCLLIGLARALDWVGQSDAAFVSLMSMLRKIAVVTETAQEGLTIPVWQLAEAAAIEYQDAPLVTDPELGM